MRCEPSARPSPTWHGADGSHRMEKVQLEGLDPILRCRFEQPKAGRAAHVRYEYVDPTETRGALFHEPFDFARLSHVGDNAMGIHARGAQFRKHLLDRLTGPAADADRAALSSEPLRDRPADPPAAAGDQPDFPFQSQVHP